MKFADRVQETSTVTDTTTINLGGAVAGGFRTFASVPDFPTGTTGIGVMVVDGNGNWEGGTYTLTSAGVLTREGAPLTSSNNNLPVVFPAGTKSILCTPLGDALTRGLVNPNDVGFDIILIAPAQSNGAGRGAIDTVIDTYEPRIFQWGCTSSQARYQTIFPATEPLQQTDGFTAGQMGPAISFAKAYLRGQPANRMVLLVPCAVGGTAMCDPTTATPWAVGGTLYNNAISQANAAIAAAKAAYPNSRFVGCYGAQGEQDSGTGTRTVAKATYVSAYKAVIAGFRSNITGAANSWLVMAGMAPGFISQYVEAQTIRDAHIQIANELDRAWYVPGRAGYDDGTHYNAAGLRFLGTDAGLAVPSAQRYIATPAPASALVLSLNSASVVNGSTVTATVAFDHSLTTGQSYSATLTAPVAGSWSVNPVVVTYPAQTGTSVFTPSATGSGNVTAAATGLTGGSAALTVTAAASAVTVSLNASSIANGSPVTATLGTNNPLFSGQSYSVTMAAPVAGSWSVNPVTMSFAAPNPTSVFTPSATGSGNITGTASGLTTGSAALTVTASDTTAPVFGSAQVANATPNRIDITMTEASGSLAASVPPTSAFTASGGRTVTGVAIVGLVVQVTVNTAYASGDAITIAYTQPGANPRIQDGSGNLTATFTAQSVTNNISAATSTTWDPAAKDSRLTLSNGNLTISAPAGTTNDYINTRSTVGKTSGKWYWEVTVGSAGEIIIGVADSSLATNTYPGSTATSVGWYGASGQGQVFKNAANATIGSPVSFTTGDILGFALDLSVSPATLRFYKNGVAQFGSAYSFTPTSATYANIAHRDKSPAGQSTANFGATAFAYTPPTGFVALA